MVVQSYAIWPHMDAAGTVAYPLTVGNRRKRYSRAEVMKIKELDYARAARAAGASTPRILARHLLPNALPPPASMN